MVNRWKRQNSYDKEWNKAEAPIFRGRFSINGNAIVGSPVVAKVCRNLTFFKKRL